MADPHTITAPCSGPRDLKDRPAVSRLLQPQAPKERTDGVRTPQPLGDRSFEGDKRTVRGIQVNLGAVG